jgi:hypothetical protein
MKKRSLKKLLVIFLFLFVVSGSSLAFAWWDDLTDTQENQDLVLGNGVRLSVDSIVEDERVLVPAGSFYAAYEADYTTAYTFEYNLVLEQALTTGALANLQAAISAFTVDGVAYDNSPTVFTVTISDGSVSETDLDVTFVNAFTDAVSTYTVTVTIELEPQSNTTLTSSEYDAIANGTVAFTIDFELINNGSSSQ